MNVAQEFGPLYRAAKALDLDGCRSEAALVTITRTRGSTFRRAGTSMLVQRDGTLVCELSGGCPQHDMVLRAHRAMDSGETSLVSYGPHSNYDVMIETGCGGELEIFIEPWRNRDDLAFLDAIEALHAKRMDGVLASVFAEDGHAARARPQRMVWSRHTRWTNIVRPSLEAEVLASMGPKTVEPPDAVTRRLDAEGRHYETLIESIEPPPALIIIGEGVGARALAQMSRQLGWRTTVVGTRSVDGNEGTSQAHRYQSPESLAREVMLDRQTSVVVMTHRLEQDLAYLDAVAATPVRYIGVIGSRRRAQQIQAAFAGDAQRLHVPAGLDVGSETPQEIALAITAEILATINGRHGGSLARSPAPIHP